MHCARVELDIMPTSIDRTVELDIMPTSIDRTVDLDIAFLKEMRYD
ncbi:MAG: hypothetical protein JGK26_05425 [Microcoleus sp. PH2017_27_LUM_O_A]|nr:MULTISPECIES: hypothetical protein [unclassified Microcoleus]MCC3459205.1 hypothetical protein [Microcoleus sp. PH2017_11_PCY_U_A]MCC3540855.1 hypothetical protein [Microcoleus sp. PH2017_22_RUC_O_B]MCC3558572.1 hypothetical protein [Microcoleus sp. PH2017_27_LUM_O_A]